jgi:3-oxoacyl-[acyl-carrier protein] reductase
MKRLSKLSRSVAGHSVIVTGAASGMGRATAHVFSDEGARVAVVDINADGVKNVVEEIRGAGGEAAGWAVDLADAAAIPGLVEDVAERFGGVDVLINNAGVSSPTAIDGDGFAAAWAKNLAVNLEAQIGLIQACLPHLRKSEAPRIVNIASTEGLGATGGMVPYTATKHGVVGLTRSLAVELGREGITVNCICPGPIHTGMTAMIPDEHKTKFARRRVPMRRYADPEEVAQVTLSLALPASSYLTGAIIPVDGGLIVQNT